MPPKKANNCPTNAADVSDAARQAKNFNEFRSAMSGLGCSAARVGELWKEMPNYKTTAKKRSADEAEIASPSAKKGVAASAKKASPKVASPKAASPKTPKTPKKTTRTPRKTIQKASPKAASPKATSPKAPTPKRASPPKPSPKAKTPKASPKASPIETAAVAVACYADGVDWSKCLESESYGEKCMKSLRKNFPDLFACPSCPKKESAASAVKESTGAPPPPPPPPPPMPKKAVVAMQQVTQDYAGATSLLSDKKGIIGMMAGHTLKKVQPPTARPAFQAMPIVAADASVTKALADAPKASATERAKLGDVAEATDLMSQIMQKQGNLKKTAPATAKPAPQKNDLFTEMAAKAGTLRKTEGPGKSAFKTDKFAGNALFAALAQKMSSIRSAYDE